MFYRSPQDVAKRSIILGALSLRGSLEVTKHPRVIEISAQLHPWLVTMRCEDHIDPIEFEQFTTPFGCLSESQWLDVKSAEETALFFSWTLGLITQLYPEIPANHSSFDLLKILEPSAEQIISAATLRQESEVTDFYRQIVLIRSILQESRIDPKGKAIVRRVNLAPLLKMGINIDNIAVKNAEELVNRLNAEERRAASGLCMIRAHAASWLFDPRPEFFAQS